MKYLILALGVAFLTLWTYALYLLWSYRRLP